jgi:membrane-anchored mycosin MYCP
MLLPASAGAAPNGSSGSAGSPASTGSSSGPLPTDPYAADIPNYSQTTECVQESKVGARLKNGISWAQIQLAYPSVWDLANSGRGQTVAVIDTGVNAVAPLTGRLTGAADFVKPPDLGLEDCDGHGTSVAGLIAATPDPASGFAGVAPKADILSIRQSSLDYGVKNAKQGSPNAVAGTTVTLADAIRVAADRHASVINISLANCYRPGDVNEGVLDVRDAVQYAIAHNAVVVAAGGNIDPSGDCKTHNTPGRDPVTLPTPANIPGVLAVAAVDQQGNPAAFSIIGSWVGVAAPGVDIVATDPVAGSSGQINLSTGATPLQGTSFAAPYVSGLVALVRNRYPYLDPAQVIHRIEQTAQHPAAPGGFNEQVGHGLIDPRAALTAVVPGEPRQPSVVPRSGPGVLPAAIPHRDPEHDARRFALIGALVITVLIAAGVVANSTRRRRAELAAQRTAQREQSRPGSAWGSWRSGRRR